MAEMNNNTADLLQQLIDIKDDIRGSIQYKGVNVVGGMIDYPYAIDRIRQDGSTYAYKIPTADVNGLEEIGWNSESIKYFADNNLQYDGLSDYFKVSEENKALYGVVNEEFFRRRNEYGQPIQDLNLQYCPYFDITDAIALFQEQFQIKGVPLFDTSSITDMGGMFFGCIGLMTVPPLNTSSVTDMNNMFNYCSNLNDIPLLDTSSVTDMSGMFNYCSKLTSIPLFDTSSVTNMSNMFHNCSNLTTIPLLNTSSVTSMSSMFGSCESLTTIPLFDTSSVTNMNGMFRYCTGLESIPLLNTSSVTNMNYMFNGCTSLTTIPQLDVSKVTYTNYMFESANLESIPSLNFYRAKNVVGMFADCRKLKSIGLLNFEYVTTKSGPMGYSSNKPLLNELTDIAGFEKLKVTWSSMAFELCPNLTVESLMNIINNLWDWTDYPDGRVELNDGRTASFGTTHTMSFGTDNLIKLTEEQIAVATNKGWTLV